MRNFLFIFVCLLLIINHAFGGVDKSLVLYLPLNENSGNIARDLSPQQNHAELKGRAKWAPGKYGSGIELTTGAWLEVPNSPSLQITKALTINCWVLIRGMTGEHQSAVEKGDAWEEGEYNLLPCYNPDSVLLQMNDLPEECDDEALGGKVNDGQWHFIAGTWDGKVIKTFIDGKESSKLACAGELGKNNDPLFIGSRGGTQRFMNGFIDEIKVYNRALSEEEIRRDMVDPTANLSVNAFGKVASTWGHLKHNIGRVIY